MFPENRFMEVLIIGALALIVIGPKDLPILMRRIGQFMGKVRGMAAEFRASFDELARQSELDELRREVEALRKGTSLTDEAASSPGVLDEIKNNLNFSMTPAMTPLSPPEVVTPAAEPPAAPAAAPVGETAPKPARKPRAKSETTEAKPRTPRKTQARVSGPAS